MSTKLSEQVADLSAVALPQLATIAERLEFATRDDAVRDAVVVALGRNPVTLKRYVTGTSKIPAEVIAVAAAATNLSAEWLLTGVAPRKPVEIASDDIVLVPRLAVRASAGGGRAVVPADEDAQSFAFRRAWLRSLGISPGNAEFLEAAGDSMDPTIKNGDLMLVDRGYGRVADGKIYVFVRDGLVSVKRVQTLALGGLMLISDNERYPNETIPASEVNDLSIEARVAWYGRAI